MDRKTFLEYLHGDSIQEFMQRKEKYEDEDTEPPAS